MAQAKEDDNYRDDLRYLLDLIDSQGRRIAALEQGEWLPIETAPKDGTEILAWRDSRVQIMRWKAIEGHHDGGFWDRWHAKLNALSVQPTHWLPLPTGPQG